MDRRNFLKTAGSVSAATLISFDAFAESGVTPLHVRGLVMVSFNDPDYLKLALPEAPHHKAILNITPKDGEQRTVGLNGHAQVVGVEHNSSQPKILLPELVKMTEIYGSSIKSLMEKSHSIISIPWSAVHSISTHKVSKNRWTFIREDTGNEVQTFRPRKLAESLKIELRSTATLKFNDGKLSVPLSEVRELGTDFIPVSNEVGDFSDHFAYYMPYVETGNKPFGVKPKELGKRNQQTPSFGNSFAMVIPLMVCFLIELP